MFPSFRLVAHTGPIAGKAFPLEKSELFVGRDLGNDIVINDPEMSRRHARLYLQGPNYVIEDLGSTNGTYVNGQRLMGPYIMRPGEVITFGERISMVMEATAADPGATMVGGRGPAPTMQPVMPQQPVYQQPPPQAQPRYTPPPPVQPVYQQAPIASEVVYEAEAPVPTRRGLPTWAIVVAVALLAVFCLCLIAGFIIDSFGTEAWCGLFGPILRAFGYDCP